MLSLDLFWAFVSKMCPKVSEKSQRACKGIVFTVILNIIKRFNPGEHNKDIAHALNLLVSTIRTIYTQREKNL